MSSRRQVFRLSGDGDVQMELLSADDRPQDPPCSSFTTTGPDGSLSLHLEGFSGQLILSRVVAAGPVMGEDSDETVSPLAMTLPLQQASIPRTILPQKGPISPPAAVENGADGTDLVPDREDDNESGEGPVTGQEPSFALPQSPVEDGTGLEESGKHTDRTAEGEEEPSTMNDRDEPTAEELTKQPVKGGRVKNAWDRLRVIVEMQKQIPDHVKERRSHRQESIDPPPTALHAACAKPDVTLPELLAAYDSASKSVAVKDSRGCLPLHILADNDYLLQESTGRDIASVMCLTLMKAYPEGITMEDDKGRIPFVALIEDWMSWLYEDYPNEKTGRKVFGEAPTGTAAKMFGAVSSTLASLPKSQPQKGDAETHAEAPKNSIAWLSGASMLQFPPVDMWDEVEWSFVMLSVAMDELAGKSGGVYKKSFRAMFQGRKRDAEARDKLAKCVITRFPALLKTLLLLETGGGEARSRVFKMSIVRRILLCPESVGPWLTHMLRKKGIPSHRAVDYLMMISSLSVEDLVGSWNAILSKDHAAFQDAQELVFEAVDKLDQTVASLVVLDEQETERAASTRVVWFIMDKNLERPFVVSLVLIDFVLHITLLLAFRNDVALQDALDTGTIGDVPTSVVTVICSHYLIRKACEAVSLLSLSTSVLRSYFMNLWTLFDLVAIILTLAAVTWNDNHPDTYRQGLNAFVLGLLWIKVLAFLKVVNKQMATFILALFQILKDIRYFGVVLLVVLFMFGDMFNIAVSTKDDGEFCYPTSSPSIQPSLAPVMNSNPDGDEPLSDPAQDFCSPVPLDSFLRVYALLLGDFELADYQETTGMTVLFVIFTLLGVVILLNVLIAVIGDSYEKAKISSLLLFGRARVTFVASNQALESFLQPGTNPLAILMNVNSTSTALTFVGQVGRWLVLLSLIATAMIADIYIVSRAYTLIRDGEAYFRLVILIIMCILLTMALWIAVAFALGNLIRSCSPDRLVHLLNIVDSCTEKGARFVARWLFGLQESVRIQHLTLDDEGTELEEEEWTGRLGYIEKSFEKTVGKAKDELMKEMHALEKRMYAHQKETQQVDP